MTVIVTSPDGDRVAHRLVTDHSLDSMLILECNNLPDFVAERVKLLPAVALLLTMSKLLQVV